MATAILHEYDSVTETAYYFHFHLLLSSGSINIFIKKKTLGISSNDFQRKIPKGEFSGSKGILGDFFFFFLQKDELYSVSHVCLCMSLCVHPSVLMCSCVHGNCPIKKQAQ